MSTAQYSADETRRLQVTLVTDFLEMAADASVEINPNCLKACAMLLAGAAYLADPGEIIASGEIPTSFSNIGNASSQD
jgi:hypothetical protein